jgi:uncharacterized Zn finger protein
MSGGPEGAGGPILPAGAPDAAGAGPRRPIIIPRRPDQPRRVANGIRLRGSGDWSHGSVAAQRWADLMLAAWNEDARREGLDYARGGQIAELHIGPDGVRASVQGRAPRPYQAELRLGVIPEPVWERLIGRMVAEAMHAARLLSGDVPAELGALFAAEGQVLLPVDPGAVEIRCTCGRATPCKHTAAVAWLLGERLDEEPLLAFTLRGLSGSGVIDRLRQARALHTSGVASAHAEPLIHESHDAVPLEECLDEFWRAGPELAQLDRQPPPHHAPHALLRRLGPSPLKGRFPLAGILASVYDTVSEAVARMRQGMEETERLRDEETKS